MMCEFYCENGSSCRKGMPLTPLYEGLICRGKPSGCPLRFFELAYLFECP